MSHFECDGCGLTASDLPDGIEPEFVFGRESHDAPMLCQGCEDLPETRRLSAW